MSVTLYKPLSASPFFCSKYCKQRPAIPSQWMVGRCVFIAIMSLGISLTEVRQKCETASPIVSMASAVTATGNVVVCEPIYSERTFRDHSPFSNRNGAFRFSRNDTPVPFARSNMTVVSSATRLPELNSRICLSTLGISNSGDIDPNELTMSHNAFRKERHHEHESP